MKIKEVMEVLKELNPEDEVTVLVDGYYYRIFEVSDLGIGNEHVATIEISNEVVG